MHPWSESVFEGVRQRVARMPHALLIHGARGVGKLALAERIAQFLLCEHPEPSRRPCGGCEGCRWFLAGNHPDFRRLEPEALAREIPQGDDERPARRAAKPSTEIKIDQVRELADFVNVGSHRGGARIALVHPAEDMNPYAANALLKGLEEPPPGAVFVLVSHRPARLLPTIRSRCVALPVSIPPREAALGWLAGQGVKDAGRWLAYAGGAPLLALEYAAQGPALERLIRSPDLVDDREGLERLAEALQKSALDQAFSAFGLAPKYGTPGGARRESARAWLAFARRMGESRALARHPVNPRLFSAEMLAAVPKDLK